MANETFKTKVAATLKGGDDVVIGAILDTAEKLWKKEVDNAKKLRKSLKEKFDDRIEILTQDKAEAEADFESTFLNISLTAKVREQRESFIHGEYQTRIENAHKKVQSYEKQIEDEKANFEKEGKRLDDIIANYTLFLKNIGIDVE